MLQDQHFDLRRTTRLPGGSDARIAAAAAIEGHANLVAGALNSQTTSLGGGKLRRFVELERGFTDSVGLRFAADLRNLGGTKAVLASLRRFPVTSEQVFHLDAYLERERALPIVLPVDAAGMTLVRDSTFGELDVRALLAVFGVPRLDLVATGWGGGRSALYRGAAGDTVLIALDWDTDGDAQQWAEAVRRVRRQGVRRGGARAAGARRLARRPPAGTSAATRSHSSTSALVRHSLSGSISTPPRSSLGPFSAQPEDPAAVTRSRDST